MRIKDGKFEIFWFDMSYLDYIRIKNDSEFDEESLNEFIKTLEPVNQYANVDSAYILMSAISNYAKDSSTTVTNFWKIYHRNVGDDIPIVYISEEGTE